MGRKAVTVTVLSSDMCLIEGFAVSSRDKVSASPPRARITIKARCTLQRVCVSAPRDHRTSGIATITSHIYAISPSYLISLQTQTANDEAFHPQLFLVHPMPAAAPYRNEPPQTESTKRTIDVRYLYSNALQLLLMLLQCFLESATKDRWSLLLVLQFSISICILR